jgi:PAS domain S-box-containing protein
LDTEEKTREQLLEEIHYLRHRLSLFKHFEDGQEAYCSTSNNPIFNSIESIGNLSPEEQMMFAKFSVEVSADEVFWMRADSKIIYVNDSACKRLGYTRDELLRMHVWDWDPIFSKEVWQEFWRDMQAKKAGVFETRHRTKNGDVFPVEISARLFEHAGSEYLFAFVKDITEPKRAEEELKQYRNQLEDLVEERTRELAVAKEAAEAANHAKSQFLANMSHELRTPLNAILGFSEILDNLIVDPKQKDYIDRVRSSGNALLSLINDILDFSKIEAGKLVINYAPCSIRHLFEEIRDIFVHKTIQKSNDIQLVLDSELPAVLLLDELRIRQVLLNLVGNAAKFTEDGTITISAYTETDQNEQTSRLRLVFSVADTGIGIPEDQLLRIFDTFEQQDGQDQAQYGGTGLGLAITRRLLETMNGRIFVESTPGSGSIFTVVLEDVEVAALEALKMQESDEFDSKAIRFGKATVLIVDDINYNRDLLRGFLSGYGLELIEAENGSEAIEKSRRYLPDLVLMDMKMPVMDGYKASKIMNDDPELKNIPVVAVTASALRQDEEEILLICDGYLRKPVGRSELIKEVTKYLPHSISSAKTSRKASDSRLNRAEAAKRAALLPEDIVERLYRALMLGDLEALDVLVDEIKECDARLGDYIGRKIKQYRFEMIINMLEKKT